jgi:hypothetical protein
MAQVPRATCSEAHATDEVMVVDKEVLCVLDHYRAREPQRKYWRLERGPGQVVQVAPADTPRLQ